MKSLINLQPFTRHCVHIRCHVLQYCHLIRVKGWVWTISWTVTSAWPFNFSHWVGCTQYQEESVNLLVVTTFVGILSYQSTCLSGLLSHSFSDLIIIFTPNLVLEAFTLPEGVKYFACIFHPNWVNLAQETSIKHWLPVL